MEALLNNIANIAARAATPAKWLIVLGMAYTLASTVLFIAAPQEAVSVQTPDPAANASGSARPAADLDSIVRANLFGAVGARAAAAAQAANEALVETRLPLELHGVFVADTPGESTAILSRKGRSEEMYHIGDLVPGNATLEAVHLDHVLLLRGRSRERLAFPRPEKSLVTPSGPAASAEAGTLDARALRTENPAPRPPEPARPNAAEPSPKEMARRYRERLKDDPRQALGEIGLTPVSGDGPSGYRLDRLAESPYLRQTGLQPGDVILSINGQPMGNVERDRLELDNVFAQGSARLEVRRGERRFFITASLD